MVEDFADRHVRRWRGHWIDIDFDDDIERLGVRIMQLNRYFDATTQRALEDLGLAGPEYDTLHRLIIRDTPGRASTGDLTRELGLSGAGMTKRLDGLEAKTWVTRVPGIDDRRRVDVVVTDEGTNVWRHAMEGRGSAEHDLAGVLSRSELRSVNRLLRKLTMHAEATDLPSLRR